MKLPLPESLSGRLIALLLLALALAQLASLAVFNHERGRAAELAARDYMQSRIVSSTRRLLETAPARRGDVLRDGHAKGVKMLLAPRPRRIGPADSREEIAFAKALRSELGDRVGAIHVRMRAAEDARRPFIATAVELPEGQWLIALKALRELPPRWSPASLLALALSVLFVIAAVVLGVRGITASLRRLSDAADRLGRGDAVEPLPETGPAELQLSARAFNRMRERLERYVSDRTRMLAAISHDLRTPITALRLRAEFIEDEENRARILQTLDEMQRMTEATLDFVRTEQQESPAETVDLNALVDALADDYRALGQPVAFQPGIPQVMRCRPVAIRRALQNLIDNALAYGEQAELYLNRRDTQLEIVVADDGPGIPDDAQTRVFDPFVRLEESRNEATGGVGLGLSIARGVARAHGGDVLLRRSPQNRFEAVLVLPAQ